MRHWTWDMAGLTQEVREMDEKAGKADKKAKKPSCRRCDGNAKRKIPRGGRRRKRRNDTKVTSSPSFPHPALADPRPPCSRRARFRRAPSVGPDRPLRRHTQYAGAGGVTHARRASRNAHRTLCRPNARSADTTRRGFRPTCAPLPAALARAEQPSTRVPLSSALPPCILRTPALARATPRSDVPPAPLASPPTDPALTTLARPFTPSLCALTTPTPSPRRARRRDRARETAPAGVQPQNAPDPPSLGARPHRGRVGTPASPCREPGREPPRGAALEATHASRRARRAAQPQGRPTGFHRCAPARRALEARQRTDAGAKINAPPLVLGLAARGHVRHQIGLGQGRAKGSVRSHCAGRSVVVERRAANRRVAGGRGARVGRRVCEPTAGHRGRGSSAGSRGGGTGERRRAAPR